MSDGPHQGVEVDDGRLADICDRYGIAELQIFGSQAHGTAGPDSDIDVLYTLRPGRRLGWEIEQLADELTDCSAAGWHPCTKNFTLTRDRMPRLIHYTADERVERMRVSR